MFNWYIFSTATGGGTGTTSAGGSGISSINGATGPSITFAGVSGIFVVRDNDTIYVGYNGQPDLTASGFIKNVDFVSSGYQTRDNLTASGYLRAIDRMYPVDARAVSGHIVMDSSGTWNIGSESAPVKQIHMKSGMFHDYFDLEVLAAPPSTPAGNTVRTFAMQKGNIGIYGVQDGDGFIHNLFSDSSILCKNGESSGVVTGQVVKIVGAVSSAPIVELADINNLNNNINDVIGVVAEPIASNGFGHIITQGFVFFNTSQFNDGDAVYLSRTNPGELVNTTPSGAGDLRVGFVVKGGVGNGEVYVDLGTITNVSRGTISNSYTIGSGVGGDTISVKFLNSNVLNLSATPTATRTVTIPDDTGTITLLDNIKAGNGISSLSIVGNDVYINTSGFTTLASVQSDLHTSGYIRNADFVQSGFITKSEIANSGFATYSNLHTSGYIRNVDFVGSGYTTLSAVQSDLYTSGYIRNVDFVASGYTTLPIVRGDMYQSGFIKNSDFLASGYNQYQVEWSISGPLGVTSGFDGGRYIRKNSRIADISVWARCPSGTITFSLSSGLPGAKPVNMYSSNTKPTVTSGDYQCSVGKVPDNLLVPSGALLYANIESVNANVLVKTGLTTFVTTNTASGACMQLHLNG